MNQLIARFATLAAFAVGCAAPLSAATFDFTYVFGNGQNTASGSFDGTQVGNVVEDITNISLTIDGTAITGPIQTVGFGLGGWTVDAVVGFSVVDSNFLFTDRDPPPWNGSYQPGDYFFFVVAPFLSAASSYDGTTQTSEVAIDANGGATGWTLTERTSQTSGVPDQANTVILLGVALVGTALARRRSAR